MKKVIVSVINDLSTDQRVDKVCTTLSNMNFEVLLVGRKRRNSLDLAKRNYQTKRMFLLFEKGPLFYLGYQIRLFFFLLFKKSDVLVSNDLDTLLPNRLISKLKNIQLVYDTHELFCEVPELMNSKFKRGIWKKIEKSIFPKLKNVFTVNKSIATIYQNEYNVNVKVVRNVPYAAKQLDEQTISKAELGISEEKQIIILQGAGINIDRGAEEAVEAMRFVDNAVLLIIGTGDVIDILKQNVLTYDITGKVKFIGKVPFEKLLQYTKLGNLGLTLDKDTNLNYKYSLPNKLFDYIHSGLPVLSSNLVEIRKIIEQYDVGAIIESHSPKDIAHKINEIFENAERLNNWKKNTKIAAEKLCWEHEEKQLIEVYSKFL